MSQDRNRVCTTVTLACQRAATDYSSQRRKENGTNFHRCIDSPFHNTFVFATAFITAKDIIGVGRAILHNCNESCVYQANMFPKTTMQGGSVAHFLLMKDAWEWSA